MTSVESTDQSESLCRERVLLVEFNTFQSTKAHIPKSIYQSAFAKEHKSFDVDAGLSNSGVERLFAVGAKTDIALALQVKLHRI